MTPKNREELVDWLGDSPVREADKDRPHQHVIGRQIAARVLEALDAAGLVIVPKGPTSEMSQAGNTALNYALVDIRHNMTQHLPTYRAMIEASPFK